MHVRGQLIDNGDMARTADNIVANEQLFRIGFTAAVIVTMCNLPLGFILYELFKVVNPRLALLALVFITASATLRGRQFVKLSSAANHIHAPGVSQRL